MNNPRTCIYYAQGRCNKGADCPFAHNQVSRPVPVDICKHFARTGNCRFGDGCRFAHSSDVDDVARRFNGLALNNNQRICKHNNNFGNCPYCSRTGLDYVAGHIGKMHKCRTCRQLHPNCRCSPN